MNLEQFTVDAKRTESVPENVQTNTAIFEPLQETLTNLLDCFDLIKKNVFYGKEIDVDRFNARLTVASHTITQLKNRCQENSNFINNNSEVAINPREFHGILGLITEAGELLELVNLHREEIDPLKIADELGDAFWYIAILADSKGLDIENQILEGVIAKLRKRFPEKFDAALAVVRDKEAELAETSAVTGINDLEVPKPKPKNKGGRPRKKPVPSSNKTAKKSKTTKKKE